jgi:hypothetical protein
VAVLAHRDIPHSPPVPYVGAWPDMASTELFHPRDPAQGRSRLWTWIFVGGFFGDQAAAKRFSNPVYRFPGVASLIGRSRRAGGGRRTISRAVEAVGSACSSAWSRPDRAH